MPTFSKNLTQFLSEKLRTYRFLFGLNHYSLLTSTSAAKKRQRGSVAKRVKAPFLWRPCDHDCVI